MKKQYESVLILQNLEMKDKYAVPDNRTEDKKILKGFFQVILFLTSSPDNSFIFYWKQKGAISVISSSHRESKSWIPQGLVSSFFFDRRWLSLTLSTIWTNNPSCQAISFSPSGLREYPKNSHLELHLPKSMPKNIQDNLQRASSLWKTGTTFHDIEAD